MLAFFYGWWSIFVRLADPNLHREAITSRPLFPSAIATQTRHAGKRRSASPVLTPGPTRPLASIQKRNDQLPISG